MGHSLSAQHAPEDGASRALFPYSYAYKDPIRGFRTVMAYACTTGNCAKIPNFSNPSVSHNGAPTGTATHNNALSINNAAATVANFRQGGNATSLAAPTNLTATVAGSTVTLQWGAVTGAEGYTLLVGSGPNMSNLFNAPVGNTTSVSGSLGPGTYVWRVFAAAAGMFSPSSIEWQFTIGGACSAPAAPLNLQFSIAGRAVTLTWSPSFGGASPTNYRLEAGAATGFADLYNASVGLTTSLTAQVPPGVYYVRVRAENGCGIGAASNERVIFVP
jgi:hypothetical protein